MTLIEKHLAHMLSNDNTTLENAADALLTEITAITRDSRALERLGRHVLAVVSADLKSGLHAQKALHTMKGDCQ